MLTSPRRWFAFRLRTVFVVLAVLCVWLACFAWLVQWAQRQRWPDAVYVHDSYFVVGNAFFMVVDFAAAIAGTVTWIAYRRMKGRR